MKLQPNTMFHIYNRGNNREQIFYNNNNYDFFLRKVNKHLSMHLGIFAYCLIPNHFHFMIYTKPNFTHIDFSNDFRVLLSSYARAINNQEKRVGSLFQQNSKAKNLETKQNKDYPFFCFNYIHQNPLKGGHVKKMEDWEYSSFREYITLAKTNVCNTEMASQVLDLQKNKCAFYEMSYGVIDDEVINAII